MNPIAEQLRPLVSTDVEAETLARYLITQYQRAEDDLDPDMYAAWVVLAALNGEAVTR